MLRSKLRQNRAKATRKKLQKFCCLCLAVLVCCIFGYSQTTENSILKNLTSSVQPNEGTTLVTGYWHIGRSPLNKFKKDFSQLLQTDAPMVIFVEPSMAEFVHKTRPPQFQTQIVTLEIKDMYFYKYHDRIQEITQSEFWVECLGSRKYTDRLLLPDGESLFSIIIHNKLQLLYEVSASNPFHSNFFMWVDAGISKHFKIPKTNFPNEAEIPSDKLMIFSPHISHGGLEPMIWKPNRSGQMPKSDNICSMKNQFMAGVFVASATVIKEIFPIWIETFERILLANVVNNEQRTFHGVWTLHPDMFKIYGGTQLGPFMLSR